MPAQRAVVRIAEATAGRAQLVVVGHADPGREQPVQLRRGDRRRRGPGGRAQAVPAQLQGVLRAPMVQPGRRQGAGRDRAGRPEGALRDRSAVRGSGQGGRAGPEGVVVGIEICEDLWVPVPPSALQAMAGATVLLNISASNETIGKSQYRTDLVVGQSGRCVAAYAMAGCGPSESTTDVVFGGHCLIAENGVLLAESPRVGDGQPVRRESYCITRDVDVARAADRPPRHDQLRRPPVRRCGRSDASPSRFHRRWRGSSAWCRGRRSCRRRVPSCTAVAPRSSASSARGWPSGSSSSPRARR